MHYIQNFVLRQLTLNEAQKYSQIKPADTEGNLFMYHLKQLMKQGLVIKQAQTYALTPSGQQFVDRLSLRDMSPRIQPKIVTLLVCRNGVGEYLLYKRRREPFNGLIGLPYGKIHLGETVSEAARRELNEKTGLTAFLTHAGDLYWTVYAGEKLQTQMLCHVFAGSHAIGNLKTKSDIGECFWSRLDAISPDRLMPGIADILKLTQASKTHFFAELTYRI